ncbi:enoyl-CoA hydratase/isomerase family protein [Rhodococcus sp. IEGM 1366]|uniref:enoyl-CoA hydratase/isomerase family protein n=1 Tax=Rhodococcus sp. IEGM 1366 TaxID=3082223 RepID=UPI003988AAEF
MVAPRRIPVRVNGQAVGGGVCLALACDLRIAGHNAVFSKPFVSRGAHGGLGSTWLLPEAVGLTRAQDIIYTG